LTACEGWRFKRRDIGVSFVKAREKAGAKQSGV
jgi:hypothetical protein